MNLHKIQLTNFAKWTCYVLLVYAAYILQATPGLFVLFGIKPVLILPVCIAVASFEDEYNSAFLGAFAGLLWDLSSGRIAGFFAILFTFCCFAASVVFKSYLRQNVRNLALVNFAAISVLLMADFLFHYLMYNIAGAWIVLVTNLLPTVVYTAAVSALMLYPVRFVYHKLQPKDAR